MTKKPPFRLPPDVENKVFKNLAVGRWSGQRLTPLSTALEADRRRFWAEPTPADTLKDEESGK